MVGPDGAMCGRYTLTVSGDELIEVFGVPALHVEHAPRYNIAPTQMAPVIARDERGTRMGRLQWGLIPSRSSDASMASTRINARAETVRTKPSFRNAFERRRCLVLADGFYEWMGEAGKKQPHWIHLPGREPMTLAGIWERWKGPEATRHTFAIITVPASEDVRHIHHRMPAILPPEDRDVWLESKQPAEVEALLRPFQGRLTHHTVSPLVNAAANDEPGLIDPVPGSVDGSA